MDLPIDSLPQTVIETYQEYKRRQKILVTWLCQQRHITSSQQTRSDPDVKLSISELERITEDIVARRVIIPEDIIYAARTMLKMRKEVALHYQDAEEGHQSCIQIFENVVTALCTLPRMPATPSHHDKPTRGSKTQAAARNRFASLPHVHLQGLSPDYIPFQNLTLGGTKADEISTRSKAESHPRNKEKGSHENSRYVDNMITLGFLHSIASCRNISMQSLSRARQGTVPLHIAAYVAELSFVMNWSSWSVIWYLVCGRETLTSSLDDMTTTLEDFFAELQNWCRMENNETDVPICLQKELLEANSCLNTFDRLSRSGNSPDKIDQTLANPTLRKNTPYKDLVPASLDIVKVSDYCMQIIPALNLATAVREIGRETKLGPACPSRLLDLHNFGRTSDSLPMRLFWSNSLYMMLRMAQSFEYGCTENADLIPCNELKPPVNCRLKSLALSQEVLKALDVYMPPRKPGSIGLSTCMNLYRYQRSLKLALKDKRFDSVTQHPVMAGTEIMLTLDMCYQLGMQLLAFHDIFLGCLHVYSALRSLNILDEISVLEVLCHKFVDAAFYGSRPCKKFFKAWDHASHYFNYSHANTREVKNLFNNRHHHYPVQFHSNLTNVPEPVPNERGQFMYEESRLNHNKRFHATKHSFCHRIFNQKQDIWVALSDEIVEELCGEKANCFKSIGSKTRQRHLKEEEIDELMQQGYTGHTQYTLSRVEEAMLEEFSDPFPLMAANLFRVYHHCLHVLSKVIAKEARDMLSGPRLCLRDVLRECDEIVAKNKSTAELELNMEAYRSERLEKFKHVRRWKRAFVKEFDGSSLSDFLWKNV